MNKIPLIPSLMCSSNTLSSANVIWLKLQPLRSTICSLNISLNCFYPMPWEASKVHSCSNVLFFCECAIQVKENESYFLLNPRLHPPCSQWQLYAVVLWMYWAKQHGWEEWIKECPWKWGWSLGFLTKGGIVCYWILCRDPKERKGIYLIVIN